MSRNGSWATFSSFKRGEISDIDSNLIPDDALGYAMNVISDKDGRIKKRGPILPYLSSAGAYFYDSLGSSNDAEFANLQKGYAARPVVTGSGTRIVLDAFDIGGDDLYANLTAGITPVTGSYDTGSYTLPKINSSFNTFGLCGFPISEKGTTVGDPWNTLPFLWAGGSQNVAREETSAALQIVANASTITFPSPAAYSSFRNSVDMVGQFLYATASTTVTNNYEYVGRIIAQDNAAGTISVSPTPANTFTSAYAYRVGTFGMTGNNFESVGGARPIGATCATIHENRVVCVPQGQTNYDSLTLTGPPAWRKMVKSSNTIVWSAISGESGTAANTKSDGLLALLFAGWPKQQSLTLDTAGITGLVSLDANNLMVLCVDKILVLSGKLGTVLPGTDFNSNSINIRTISNNIGCPYPNTIQRTPMGVMFSDQSTVYVTDGASFINTMDGKIQMSYGYFAGSIGTYGADYPCGSAVIGDSHYVLFTKYGNSFVCDFTKDYAWTRLYSGTDNSVFPTAVTFGSGIQDPSGNGKVYAPQFLVNTANPPSSNGSKVSLINTILKTEGTTTSSANGFVKGNDAGATSPYNADFITKSYMFGAPTLKWIKKATFLYESENAQIGFPVKVSPIRGSDVSTTSPLVCTVGLPGEDNPDVVVRRSFSTSVSNPGRYFSASAFALRFTTQFTNWTLTPLAENNGNFGLTQFQINYVPLRMGRVKK